MKYKNKEYECGTAKLGERGQIVIPKAIREELGLKQGDNLILLGNKEEGIRIINANSLEELAEIVLKEKITEVQVMKNENNNYRRCRRRDECSSKAETTG